MRHATLFLCLIAVLITSCAKKESPPKPELTTPVVAAACTTDQAEAMVKSKYAGFEAKVVGDKVVLAKALKGADGQLLGRETHVFLVKDDKGACKFTECESSREVGGHKLVNDFCGKRSRFYENGSLVYEDLPLENGLWHRKYSKLEKIPVKAPNWATPDGMDLYMTWVLRPDDKASRVPVWPAQAIWFKEGDDYTLMAGEAVLKNPQKGITQDEVYTFMRANAQGEVVSSGVLYPVSTASFQAYLSYLKKEKDTWERDNSADETARLAFFEGPVKESRAKALPLDRVYAIRGTRSTQLPNVAPEFVPGFDKVPRLP